MLFKKIIPIVWWLYLTAMFYTVFVAGERRISASLPERINLVPVRNLILFYQTNPHSGRFYFIFNLEIFGNILLFLPFGFLIKCSYPAMKVRQVILYGLLLSVSIELTQLFLQIGVCDVGDVILNVIGVAIGVGLYQLMKKKKPEWFAGLS